MHRIISSILLSIFAVAASFAANPVQDYTIAAGDFSELKVIDPINVVYKCVPDSAGTVAFSCEPEVAPMILVSNDKNVLKIQIQSDIAPGYKLPTLHVYSNFISKAEKSGDSTLTVASPASTANLRLRVIGNGQIVATGLHATVVEARIDTGSGSLVASGQANWVKLRTVGTGNVEAGALKAEKGSIFIGGTGSVDCQVSKELTVTGLGSGKVYVKGHPQVKNRTLGTVKVIEVQ